MAILLTVAAACGDDRLTREEFIERADEICAAANERTESIEIPRNPQQIDEAVSEAEEVLRGALEELRQLRPPEEDERTVDAFLDNIEEAISHLPAAAEAARENDIAALQEEIRQAQEATARAEELARGYGFQVCAQELPGPPGAGGG